MPPGAVRARLLALLVGLAAACDAGSIGVVGVDGVDGVDSAAAQRAGDAAMETPADLAPLTDLAPPPGPADLAVAASDDLPALDGGEDGARAAEDLSLPPAPPDLSVPSLSPGSLILSEIAAANIAGLLDEDRDASDWIELLNTTAAPLDLTGVGLSTRGGQPYAFTFPPGTAIAARGRLLVFASGKGRRQWGRPLHAAWNIDSDKDRVYLTAPGNVLLDSTALPATRPDVSWCRIPDGVGPFQHCLAPTPLAANAGAAYPTLLDPPSFSVPGGFYAADQNVALSAEPGAEIRYTLDGADPTPASTLYTVPIVIQSRVGAPNRYATIPTTLNKFYAPLDSEVYKGTVLRAAAFRNGSLSSTINTHTYFVDPAPNAASRYAGARVLSLGADPPRLFSADNPRGIYVPGNNPGQPNWTLNLEIPASLESWGPGRLLELRTGIGTEIAGNATRAYAQKSLDVQLRDGYGARTVVAPLFPHRPADKLGSFRLKAPISSKGVATIRDPLLNMLLRGAPVGWNDYSPAVLFIDGEYWGYVATRERTTAEWVERTYGYDRRQVDLLDILPGDVPAAKSGTLQAYDALRAFVAAHPAEIQADFALIDSLVDAENFAHYFAANLYAGNADWLGNNVRMWRWRSQDGRIRFVLQDDDQAFGLSYAYDNNNYGLIGNGTRTATLLAAFLKNPTFRELYINVVADQLNGWLSAPIAAPVLEQMVKEIQPLMAEHYARFRPAGQSLNDWNNAINTMRTYLANREQYLVTYTQQYFGLGNQPRYAMTVNVNDVSMGTVKVNTLDLGGRLVDVKQPWVGRYFPNVPITVTALPRPGYKLVQWQGASNAAQGTITLNLNANASLTAVFAADPNGKPMPPPVNPPPPPGVRNVALGRPATQSSTAGLAAAALAVDGDGSGTPASASLAVTNAEQSPYWQVDLGQSVDVQSIDVLSRTDCCGAAFSNFHVFVSAADMSGRSYGSLVNDKAIWRAYRAAPPGPSFTVVTGGAVKGRFVRVQLAESAALALAEVRVLALPPRTLTPDLSRVRNLALGAAASQSSTDAGYAAARANDGNADGRLASGSVSRTSVENQPWWQVDLGASHALSSVILGNRTDCCLDRLANVRVMVSRAPMTGRSFADLDADPAVWKYDLPSAAGASVEIPIEEVGRYLRVQLKGNGAQLALAEVAVMGLTDPAP